MADIRRGLNCTLAYRTYPTQTSPNGQLRVYRCRVFGYQHTYEMVAEEGQSARLVRSYYPHRVTVGRFSIIVQLKGYREWESFNIWMTTYARNLNDSTMLSEGSPPLMSVMLAGRQFNRVGIPISGYGFGDHLGAILWQPQIVFESATDPYAKDGYAKPSYYRETDAVLSDKVNAPYFYPFSQFAGGAKDSLLYDQVVQVASDSQQDPTFQVAQDIINGGNTAPTGTP